MQKIIKLIFTILIGFTAFACQNSKQKDKLKLEVISSSEKQWTGVAVSKEGRVFVNYPYWSDDVPVSVAEIIDGKPIAYPNKAWNNRGNEESFLAVQSVVIDARNRLWVLDTRNPQFTGVQEGGPVLYFINLKKNQVIKTYTFPDDVWKSASYFNDIRIDTVNELAYITDSGDGAIIVLDLKTGDSRRLLDAHPSTESELDYLMCDGIKWENSVHSDGIALTNDNQYLYYIALTGHTLYRIKTNALFNPNISEEALAQSVETVKKIPATDGMLFDKDGNLWLGGLEDNSINLLRTDGSVEKVIKEESIRWADSFAQDTEGRIYFTTSQIHLPQGKRNKYQVLRLN